MALRLRAPGKYSHNTGGIFILNKTPNCSLCGKDPDTDHQMDFSYFTRMLS